MRPKQYQVARLRDENIVLQITANNCVAQMRWYTWSLLGAGEHQRYYKRLTSQRKTSDVTVYCVRLCSFYFPQSIKMKVNLGRAEKLTPYSTYHKNNI